MDSAASPAAPVTSGPSMAARRVAAVIIAIAAGGILGVGYYLHPSEQGHGTHTQLGLAPCTWMTRFNLPCATCGMTTSVSYAVHGQLLTSLRTQPAGTLFAVATAAALILSTWVAWTGAAVGPLLRPMTRLSFVLTIVAVVLLAWGYKILTVRGIF